MRSNYKKLGPYIRPIDVRNKEDKQENLLGVSTRKVFIKSVANTVGTDFTKYKVVKRNQFTYVPDTSRRGDKMGLAMLDHLDEALVSSAYIVFEAIDHDKLDPEYLMMWYRRPEFDRYARFKSHGSVREMFDWEEMCDVELPIPDIDTQREIVREYNVIVDRINLNEQLCTKLEETGQALYKHWFVDFEFPITSKYAASIGKPELDGKPYKSSGGGMKHCEELEKDLPENWSSVTILDVCKVINGRAYREGEYRKEGTQIIRIQNLNGGKKWLYSDMELPENKYVSNGALIFAWSATFGPFIWRGPKSIYHYHIWRLDCFNVNAKLFLYHHLKLVTTEVSSQGAGSIFSHITKALMEQQRLVYPDKDTLSLFDSYAALIDKSIEKSLCDIDLCKDLVNVLHTKMAKAKFSYDGLAA